MTRLTDEQIAELERLEREAWVAPWVAHTFEIDCPCPNGEHCGDPHSCEQVEAPEAYPASHEDPAKPGDGQCVVQISVPGLESLAGPTAAFIAAARNALPSLLAEVRASRASASPDARPAPLPEHDPHRRFGPPDPRPTMLCPVHGEPLHSVWRCDKCPGMGVAASARPAPSAREEGPCDCACEAHPEGGCRCACDCRDAEGLRARVEAVVDEMDECADSSLDLSTEEWAERLRAALASAPASVPERATPDEHTEDEALELLHDIDDAVGLSGPQAMEVLEHIRRALVRAASGSDTGAGEGGGRGE